MPENVEKVRRRAVLTYSSVPFALPQRSRPSGRGKQYLRPCGTGLFEHSPTALCLGLG